jgi:hypothetical protein
MADIPITGVAPGWYAILCCLPGRDNGMPQALMGLLKVVSFAGNGVLPIRFPAPGQNVQGHS